ncbi:hypothetical protein CAUPRSCDRAFT_7916 [Caulochytrium protostelioides]|uniref:Uncharacterized protein n=1 Tax=Caulochytrium protostelioides TaxID=1555241 RepID=A0A4V1ITC8_9FUNG|nr:hypothetical protein CAUPRSCDRAFT_7916 [Caulochytrium protostelioides]
MPDAGCRMSDAGCWMSDAGCWMSDAGCWMPDAGCRGMPTASRPRGHRRRGPRLTALGMKSKRLPGDVSRPIPSHSVALGAPSGGFEFRIFISLMLASTLL